MLFLFEFFFFYLFFIETNSNQFQIIHAVVPLSELSEYSMNIRKTSSGTASVSMQPNGFAAMTEDQAYHAIRRAQGLE